ncbi:MAG: UPF0182 family protein [Chloracidobacterium sp.]|nr:UPF0182 family protein [Chloracidobacterium sp.]
MNDGSFLEAVSQMSSSFAAFVGADGNRGSSGDLHIRLYLSQRARLAMDRPIGAGTRLARQFCLSGVRTAFFRSRPNELGKETEFIRHNIEATRTAYAINSVEERELSGSQTLTAADIRENQRTISNIRLWDTQPLLDTFAQIQEIRTYYEFQSVDNDRYQINGEMQQVMISPRELNAASLPNQNWINEHLTFTHGYGAAVGPVDKVTAEGMPELFVKDIPPTVTVRNLRSTAGGSISR